MRFIKHLTTWLLLLTVITASGIVSAKVASGVQNLSGNLHQGNVTANALLRLAKIEFSYDAASGSPVATKSVDGVLQKIFQIQRNKGNFNIGSLTSGKAAELGRSFVGPNAVDIVKNGKTIGFRSSDGLRQFRFPAQKTSGVAAGKTQANIQEFFINAQGRKVEVRNAHIDIIQ